MRPPQVINSKDLSNDWLFNTGTKEVHLVGVPNTLEQTTETNGYQTQQQLTQ